MISPPKKHLVDKPPKIARRQATILTAGLPTGGSYQHRRAFQLSQSICHSSALPSSVHPNELKGGYRNFLLFFHEPPCTGVSIGINVLRIYAVKSISTHISATKEATRDPLLSKRPDF